MALGSDAGFYGNFGLGGGYGGQFQPWQIGQGQIGTSAYAPQVSDFLPSTLGGFAQQYIPELAGAKGLSQRFGADLSQQFRDFRFGGDVTQQGITQFANQLGQSEIGQRLVQEQEFAQDDPFLRGQQGARGLSEVVQELLGTEGSQLANIYGGSGFEADAVTRDIRNFIGGQESGLSHLSAHSMSGSITTSGSDFHTGGTRQSVLGSLFEGQGLIGLGGGRSFNPYSQDIPGYDFQAGLGGAIQGNDLLTLSGGVLASQNANITQGVSDAFSRARATGAEFDFGGEGGHRVIGGIADLGLGEGQYVQQGGDIMNTINRWFGGRFNTHQGRSFGTQLGMNIQGGA
jgi:hypothetical protein